MNMYNTELGAGPGKENGVSELQIFENQVFGQVRVFVENGEPWFVAADVCKAILLEKRGANSAFGRHGVCLGHAVPVPGTAVEKVESGRTLHL